jgi:hypothetical protein
MGDLTESEMRETPKEHEVHIPAIATYCQPMLLVKEIVEKEECSRIHSGRRLLKRAVRHEAESYRRKSTVSLNNLKPSEVHECTGFEGDARNMDATRLMKASDFRTVHWGNRRLCVYR